MVVHVESCGDESLGTLGGEFVGGWDGGAQGDVVGGVRVGAGGLDMGVGLLGVRVTVDVGEFAH